MFPSSLQKNIRELDRQISLLETECENMQAEKRGSSLNRKCSKSFTRKISNKMVICPSGGLQSAQLLSFPTMARTYSRSCLQNKTVNDTNRDFGDLKDSKDPNHSRRSSKKENNDNESTRENIQNDMRQVNAEERKEILNMSYEAKKPRGNSVESIQEETESSSENYPMRKDMKFSKQTNAFTGTSKEQQMWCDLIKESILTDKWRNRKSSKKNSDGRELTYQRNSIEHKFSSDEKLSKSKRRAESKSLSEKIGKEFGVVTPHNKISTKRRSRSARTRKKSDGIQIDVDIAKAIQEKEIEKFIWNEEREKAEFLLDLNESVKMLHLLLEEMKTKSSREKKSDVLNDIQNILLKISGEQSVHSLNMLAPQKRNNLKSLEGDESTLEMKQALFAVKKFCQELSEEKSVLLDELNTKNSTITSLLNKEKEYMSLISSLKFNLERMKEECEEGKLAKRDLSTMKDKLREEAKVIEALKKSHGKMQALVERYVLANDKLRAEVKISKLESQKFHVLLGAKEAEIGKYKQKIQLFQKQITQQLSLLRSKAKDNEVELAIEAISNQTNILETEIDSAPSEATLERRDPIGGLDRTEITSSSRTQTEHTNREQSLKDQMSTEKQERMGKSIKLSSSSREPKGEGTNLKEGEFTSCRSDDSMADFKSEDNFYDLNLRGALKSSKKMRSVNELLQEMQGTSSEKHWPSLTYSNNTSQCSVLSSDCDNVKERTRKD